MMEDIGITLLIAITIILAFYNAMLSNKITMLESKQDEIIEKSEAFLNDLSRRISKFEKEKKE
jgi:hypothetical protein